MIVLHNRHDKTSREFVQGQTDIETLDWYADADREAWLDAGGTLAVSAFPSVLMRHDAYVDEGDEEHAPGWDTVRLPASLDTPLPAVGEWCAAGLYRYGEGWVICRLAHTRQADLEPGLPGLAAIWSVWRPDTPDMVWIANEPVAVGDERIYDGARYRCLQAHTTQSDWWPSREGVIGILWELVEQEPTVPEPWVQPTGAHDAYHLGDLVTYNGWIWECTGTDGGGNNVWPPGVYGWTQVEPL